MELGDIPADWRQRRTAVRARLITDREPARFLDIESLQTREFLRNRLGESLAYLRLPDLDISDIRGRDRRLTRLISQWAFEQRDENGMPLYAGLRYLSRLNSDWECWAVFDRVGIAEQERRPILADDTAYVGIARSFNLVPH